MAETIESLIKRVEEVRLLMDDDVVDQSLAIVVDHLRIAYLPALELIKLEATRDKTLELMHGRNPILEGTWKLGTTDSSSDEGYTTQYATGRLDRVAAFAAKNGVNWIQTIDPLEIK